MVRSETRRLLASDYGRVVQPGNIRVRLDQAAHDQALRDAFRRGKVDGDGFRVERIAVARDDLAELLEIEARRHFLGERGDQLIAVHGAHRLERLTERLGELNHLGLALLEFLAAHRDAHELVGAAEVFARVGEIHRVDQHARARFLEQGQRRLLHQAGIDLPLPQGLQEIDPQGRELHLVWVGFGLLEEKERERVIGIAERGDGDGLPFEVLDGADLACGLGRGDDGEQRQASGDGEAADVDVNVGIGLDCDVERSGCVIDRAADQRLHRRLATAGIDELHVETVVLEQAGRACDLIRHAAQELAAIGELDPRALRVGALGAQNGNEARDEHRAFQHGPARQIDNRHAGGGFVTAAHALSSYARDLGASATASRIACTRLRSSALPVPAMSNAVPWSTEVRTNGSPTVMFTPASRPSTLTGPWPWSWYIATTRSKSPRPARKNSVSAGSGPSTSMPRARAALMAGMILVSSSPRPNSPPSPACGLIAQTPMRGCAIPERTRASYPRRMVRSTSAGSIFSIASSSPMWVVTWMTRILGVESIIETSSMPASLARSSVWPGYLCPPACSASLFSGAVQIASMRPAMASSTARWMNLKAASPAVADSFPKGRSSGMMGRSTVSTSPIRNAASSGRCTGRTDSLDPTIWPALRSRRASPMTSGRDIS